MRVIYAFGKSDPAGNDLAPRDIHQFKNRGDKTLCSMSILSKWLDITGTIVRRSERNLLTLLSILTCLI